MTAPRIAIIGKPGFIDKSYDKPTEQLFKEVGLNTGNLAFWYALNQHICGNKGFYGWGADPVELKDNYDIIAFPAANQLNPDWDMSHLAGLFEQADLPLLICGLGVQAPTQDYGITFKKGTLRFIDVISERAKFIGVRGEFTAEVLARNGVKNVEVMGCPSNFINTEVNLGKSIEKKLTQLKTVDSLVLNYDVTPQLAELVRVAYQWGLGRDVTFINQAPLDLVKMANEPMQAIEESLITRIRNLVAPGVSDSIFLNFVRGSFCSHFDVNTWMNQLTKADLAIGTRLHGNMLALQAGVPSIFIPHDSRTQELTDLMKVPRLLAQRIKRGSTLESVLPQVEFDGLSYDRQRFVLLQRYLKVLRGAGVGISDYLLRLDEQNNCAHVA